MKRILAAMLAISMALVLFACGEKITFDAAADFPAGISSLTVREVGKQDGIYYAVVDPGGVSGAPRTFRLADDFAAQAFEPGAVGALWMLDYNGPEDFYTQWYQQAKEFGGLGTVFSFAFAGDALVSLTDTSQPSPPDGPPMQGAALPEGVEYVEGVELQSDAGENMTAEGGAAALFSALVFLFDDIYTPGDAVTITLTGLDTIDDGDAYLYTLKIAGSESQYAVNYAGDVYQLQDGEYIAIYFGGDGRGDLIPLDADQAMYIVSELLGAQLGEGRALVAKGEGEVNGGPAFLFDLGTNTDEKFTAEEHYAVTDDGEVWLLDVLADAWQPAAAG